MLNIANNLTLFLSQCLSIKEKPISPLVSVFREGIDEGNIKMMVSVGFWLHENIISARLRKVEYLLSKNSESGLFGDECDKFSSNSFSSSERQAWNSHIQLALTIGTGHSSHKSSSVSLAETVLDDKVRFCLYQAIMEKYLDLDDNTQDSEKC